MTARTIKTVATIDLVRTVRQTTEKSEASNPCLRTRLCHELSRRQALTSARSAD